MPIPMCGLRRPNPMSAPATTMRNPSRTIGVVAMITFAAAGCGKEEPPRAVAPAGLAQASNIICSYAPSQSAVVGQISAAAGGSAAAAATIAKAAGLTAVMHSSGAYILTGAGGYVAGTLGSAIVGPVLVGVGVAVGGSAATLELLCAPRNHPEFATKVEAAAVEFASRSKTAIVNASSRTTESIGPLTVHVKSYALKVGNDAVEYANRKSVEASEAMQTLRP